VAIKSPKILLIEDNPEDALVVRYSLLGQLPPHHVDTLSKGIECLKQETYDLILLDLHLPDSQGLDSLDQLLAVAPDVPIILLTALNDDQLGMKAISLGAQDYLVKGQIEEALLKRAIKYAIERRRAEKALRESERTLFNLMSNMPGMAYRRQNDAAWSMEFVSSGCIELTGYCPADLQGNQRLSYADLIHVEDRNRIVHEVQGALEEQRPFEVTYRIITADKSEKWVWERGCAVLAPDGSVEALEGFITDITDFKSVQAALQESQQFAQSTLDALSAHIAILDDTGTIIAINEAWRQFAIANDLNDPACGLGQNYLTICETAAGDGADEAHAVAESIRQMLSGQFSEFYLEYPCHSPELQRWFMLRLNRYESKGFTRIVTAHYDITERVLAEHEEREQRALAEALRDTAAILTSTLDPQLVMDRILVSVGQVVPHDAANIMLITGEKARIVSRLGYQSSEHADSAEISLLETPYLREMYITQQPVRVPDTASDPNWITRASSSWIRSYAAVPVLAHGEVIGFLNLDSHTPGFFTRSHIEPLQAFADQAAIALENAQLYAAIRHHAEELEERVEQRSAELNRAKERAETIFNHSSEPIILAYPDGTIRQVNPAFNMVFGYTSDQTLGMPLTDLFEPDSIPRLLHCLEVVTTERQIRRLEVGSRRSDGELFDVEVGISAIANGNAHTGAIVCSIRDITEQKRSELALREALRQEKELSDLKTRFVSMASHEFRTPLAIIQAASESLKSYRSRMDDQQIEGRLHKIEAQVKDMTLLLDGVLTLGRAQAGMLEFNPKRTDIAQLCQSVIDEFQGVSDLDHHLIYTYSHTEPCLEATIDEKLVRQIITNLVSNAIKYSPPGSRVQVSLACDQAILLTVQDEGFGIPQEDQKHLFEPFYRASNIGNISGSGLGLAIAKHAVELHGGTITFVSQVGVGTTFKVSIPLADKDGIKS
jgi:PAS domain S-box-containing protein